MRSLALAVTALSLLSIAGTPLARADEPIFSQNFVPPLTDAPAPEAPPKWIAEGNRLIEQFVQGLLLSFIAGQGGLEHPAPDETPNDIIKFAIGHTNLKAMIQGGGNLQWLQPYYNNQPAQVFTVMQAGVGLEYDFVAPSENNGNMLIAVRFSPVYGEIALIRTTLAEDLLTSLPPQGFFAGSSLGVELSRRFGRFEPGMRAYARTEWETFDPKAPGVSVYSAVYCRIRLDDLFGDDLRERLAGGRLTLMPILSYYDRGSAKDDMYSWNRATAYGDPRLIGDLRHYWEGQVKMELKF